MKVILANFATTFGRHREDQNKCNISFMAHGGDYCLSMTEADLKKIGPHAENKHTKYSTGYGFFYWKPLVISYALDFIGPEDILFYSDSSAEFVANIKPVVDIFVKSEQYLMPFRLTHLEKYWTRRSVIKALGCDSPEYTDTLQILASYSLWKNTKDAKSFLLEWANYCSNPDLITDGSVDDVECVGFKAHRHDQSLFSLLCKKRGIKPYRDPSRYGNYDVQLNGQFKQIIRHHEQNG